VFRERRGRLAKMHNVYIVPGLQERDGNLVYNVAVLIGPDGTIVGKYRKVCLPRGEVEGASPRAPTIRPSRPASARSG
jgi:predicted amidohydrolase